MSQCDDAGREAGEVFVSANREEGRRSFLLRSAAIAAGVAVTGAARPASAQIGIVGPRQHFQRIQAHENSHVTFLENALGANARPKPNFQNLAQPNLRAFVATAQALENTGCGAYLGAAPAIFNRTVLAQAGSIALIEARHAGFLNTYRSQNITLNAFNEEQTFERAFTIQEVVNLASPFIADLNGGPPLTFSTTNFSDANDIAILNFALALEYLEADFYNIGVPTYFG